MNILALNVGDGIDLHSGKLVYSAAETQALQSCIETSEYLHTIKEEANDQYQQARQEAELKGYEQGLLQGRDAAAKEAATQLLQQQQTLHEAQEALRGQSVTIAMEVVKKITSQVAPEQLVLSLARTAALDIAPDSPITLHTHSDNVDRVKQLLLEQSETHAGLKQFCDVIADDNLNINGCVLETELGSIDADLTSQLAAIEQHLTGA